jgi:hypothetical protein
MFALSVTALLAVPGALAAETDAETCLRTKVWDGYSDGWGIRTMTSTQLDAGRTRNYLVTLYKGNEYQVTTCGMDGFKNLDVLLYDTTGTVIARDNTTDREPKVTFKPDKTASYYIVLYAREMDARTQRADVAMAVVYR